MDQEDSRLSIPSTNGPLRSAEGMRLVFIGTPTSSMH
jgi:hypothetical protein